jgi:hypothetical protein
MIERLESLAMTIAACWIAIMIVGHMVAPTKRRR